MFLNNQTYSVRLSPLPLLVLKALMLLLVGYYAGRILVLKPMNLMLLGFLLLFLLLYIKWPDLSMLLIFFCAVGFGGIVLEKHLLPVRIAPLTLVLSDLLLFFLVFLFLIKFLIARKDVIRSPLITANLLLLALFLVQVVRALTIQGQDMHFVGRLIRPYAFYLLFFIVVYKINSYKMLKRFIMGLFCIGIFSASLILIQYVYGFSFRGTHVSASRATYGVNQIMNYSSYLTSCLMLVCIPSIQIVKKKYNKIILTFSAILFLVTTLITFWRGGYLAIIASILALICISKNIRSRILIWIVIVIFLMVSITTFSSDIFEFDSPLVKRFLSAFSDIYYIEGTVDKRMNLFYRKYQLAKEESILFGVGFKYEDIGMRKSESLYTATGADSGYANIFFRFGIFGYIVFFWLILMVFKRIRTAIKNSNNDLYQALSLGIFAVNIYMLSMSFGSNPFGNKYGIIVLVFSWGIIERICLLNREEKLSLGKIKRNAEKT